MVKYIQNRSTNKEIKMCLLKLEPTNYYQEIFVKLV